ncbi:mediator of RNA polymerase II transcription subunit 17 [Andrographis paniculata]|uniref:mediator of RNA polymerase II transcription subunit 17 n=1 Tax=Andrographis paniculata TaxID=175694 RepID=UPI0021E8F219|nr:mediator of RNA polymerase II transcription subunit 17 [Andrographis paniculata]XP_051119342.1 mediator of RNA polymerase II transcription subunit 17 [Andrographis paniculata]
MDGDIGISLDKLPIKRLDAIEENGFERFPTDVGYDEKRVNLIRRIDFGWAVEREDPSKKRKTEGAETKEGAATGQQQWQWHSLVENLNLARQELSVIIDLINTVEANDAVTVAGMTRPKPLPNEQLSDLAVSMATKLQCFRNLGKYFKQAAQGLEEQIAREARFYGALIRLQQNWKIKRHRLVAAASGNEGFYIDLFDNSLYDSGNLFRPSSISTIPIEHDKAGMLAVKLPQNSYHFLRFEFLGYGSDDNLRKFSETKTDVVKEESSKKFEKEHTNDDERVKGMHLTLREVHRAIHDEQVFDLVTREACNPSLVVNLTGIKDKYMRLSIGQGSSFFISLVSSDMTGDAENSAETSPDRVKVEEGINKVKKSVTPSKLGYEIYLQQLFHEYVFVKAKNKANSSSSHQISMQPKDNSDILGHFCMSLAHRIFSNKVLSVLESLVQRTPYVSMISHPTWHSRTSSWTLSMKIPQSILHAATQIHASGTGSSTTKAIRSQCWTKVVVIDESITVEGEGAPNVVGLFKGKSEAVSSINSCDCDLADLPILLLQQVASQIIQWLHEEARTVGIKASRDFLSLALELEQGEIVTLVAHVDPEDDQSCITWWVTIEEGFAEERKLHSDMSTTTMSYVESENRKFLGYLPLDTLYSTLLDFLNMCSC